MRLGALGAGARDPETFERLDEFARCIGLAFQIRDDVLDVEGETATLGKNQGADVALGKPTYPAILGLEASKLRTVAQWPGNGPPSNTGHGAKTMPK